jgi:Ribonuclease G/E
LQAIHQWHTHLPPHLQGEASVRNEEYMKSKKLNEVEAEILEKKRLEQYNEIDPRLVANKGRDWGVIISK